MKVFLPVWVPPAVGARWHLGADRCFSPPLLLPSKTLSRYSALSHLAGCPWRASCDIRSCWAGPWQVAGGRRPLSSPQQAASPGYGHRGSGRAARFTWCSGYSRRGCFPCFFPPLSFFFFFSFPSLLSEELFALGLLASLILLQSAIGIRLLEGKRRGKQKAPEMPSPVI